MADDDTAPAKNPDYDVNAPQPPNHEPTPSPQEQVDEQRDQSAQDPDQRAADGARDQQHTQVDPDGGQVPDHVGAGEDPQTHASDHEGAGEDPPTEVDPDGEQVPDETGTDTGDGWSNT